MFLSVPQILLFLVVLTSSSPDDTVIMTSSAKRKGISAQASGTDYISYLPSTGLPVILAAPHGGLLEPEDIPDRDAGCWNERVGNCTWSHECGEKNTTVCKATTLTDLHTVQLTLELRAKLCALFRGLCPAAVLNLLARTKFDANRDLDEATFGVPSVRDAFYQFHRSIDDEKMIIQRGIFVDLHGQAHPIERAELGYLIRGDALNSPLYPLDPNATSIRALAARHTTPPHRNLTFDDLLRGQASFGAFLQAEGYRAVPSPADRGPGRNPYFNGGYNTWRHGSLNGGEVDAIQIESSKAPRLPDHRADYGRALACAVKRLVCAYYFDNVTSSDVATQQAVTTTKSMTSSNASAPTRSGDAVHVQRKMAAACLVKDPDCKGGAAQLHVAAKVVPLLVAILIDALFAINC